MFKNRKKIYKKKIINKDNNQNEVKIQNIIDSKGNIYGEERDYQFEYIDSIFSNEPKISLENDL